MTNVRDTFLRSIQTFDVILQIETLGLSLEISHPTYLFNVV